MKENSFLLVVLLDFQVCLGFSLTSGMTSPVSRFTRHEATNPTSQHSTWVIHKPFFPARWMITVCQKQRPNCKAHSRVLTPWSRWFWVVVWVVPPEVGWKWCGNVGKIETLMNIITYQVQELCDVMYDFLYLDPCRKMQESVCRSRIYPYRYWRCILYSKWCGKEKFIKIQRYFGNHFTILHFLFIIHQWCVVCSVQGKLSFHLAQSDGGSTDTTTLVNMTCYGFVRISIFWHPGHLGDMMSPAFPQTFKPPKNPAETFNKKNEDSIWIASTMGSLNGTHLGEWNQALHICGNFEGFPVGARCPIMTPVNFQGHFFRLLNPVVVKGKHRSTFHSVI